MGLLNYFRKEKRNAVPQSEGTEFTYEQALLFQKYSTLKALKLSAVYAALQLISNSIATMPIYVKQHKDGKNTIVENHIVHKLFYNMLQTKHTVIKQIVNDLYLNGNAFIYIKRNNQSKPEKLIYLQPSDVTIDYKKELELIQYNVSNHRNIPKLVKQEDMLHFARNTQDGVVGRGFLVFASDVIDLAGFTQQAASDYYGSGCNVTGILQFKGRVTPEQMKKIRSQWTQIHSSGMSGLGILEGDAEYTPIAQNSAEAQMLEAREFNVSEIARFFNINPVLLGDLSHNSYNTIEDANIEFIQRTLLPIINLLEEEMNRKLITNATQYIDIDETELLKGDKKTLAEYYSTLVSNGIITIDECREQLGFNAFNDGYSNKIFIPYTKISDNVINQENVDETIKEEQNEV